MRPDPGSQGNRNPTPPRLEVQVGGIYRQPPHSILLALDRKSELEAFKIAFIRLNWVVFIGFPGNPGFAKRLAEVNVLLTDQLDALLVTSNQIASTERPSVVAISDNDVSAIEMLEQLGVDNLIVRPIDLADPLGAANLRRGKEHGFI